MITAVVTGAGGFAGTWLCRDLVGQGHRVVGWVRRAPEQPVPGVDYRVQDIVDRGGCARAVAADRPDLLFHLAAVTHLGQAEADPEEARRVNVEGTRNVLEPLPDEVPAVFASTCHVYGAPRELPMGEHHPCRPQGVYATTKLEAEAVALRVHPATAVARAFHHLGPGQSTRFAFAEWARTLAAQRREGAPLALVVGDIDIRRDYTDVRDVVAGYQRLASPGAVGRVINLCSGRAPLLRELIEAMAGDEGLRIDVDPARQRLGVEAELRGDPTLAAALGWKPRRDIRQTLRELATPGVGGPGPR